MKKGIVVVLLFTRSIFCSAQVQELEELKLNIEKLAQLKLMLSQAKQGYQILQNGYNSIRDVAKGNFNLHKDYLDGLLQVSDGVRRSPLIQAAENTRLAVSQEATMALQDFIASGVISAQEMAECKQSINATIDKLNADKKLAALVLASGQVRMNDAERTEVLQLVNRNAENELSEMRRVIKDYQKLIANRKQQKRDWQSLRQLSGIK